MSKERFACQTCPAFYECCKPHMKATAGIVLNKKAIFDAMEKQEPKKVQWLDGHHRCPRCKIPIVRPTGAGNAHYCCHCGQFVIWRWE